MKCTGFNDLGLLRAYLGPRKHSQVHEMSLTPSQHLLRLALGTGASWLTRDLWWLGIHPSCLAGHPWGSSTGGTSPSLSNEGPRWAPCPELSPGSGPTLQLSWVPALLEPEVPAAAAADELRLTGDALHPACKNHHLNPLPVSSCRCLAYWCGLSSPTQRTTSMRRMAG